MSLNLLLDQFDHLIQTSADIEKLNRAILDWSFQGKLRTDNLNDEPAIDLIEQLSAQKKHLLAVGNIRNSWESDPISPREIPFDLPQGWEWIRFGDLFFDMQGGSQPAKRHFISEPREGYVRLLQIRDFGNKPVPTYVPKSMVTKFCEADDVLIGRYGASVGKILQGMNGAYNVAIVKVLFDHDLLNRDYIYYLLQTRFFQDHVLSKSRSAQSGFNKGDVFPLLMPLPPIEEQVRIVDKLNNLNAQTQLLAERLRIAESQRKKFHTAAIHKLTEAKTPQETRAAWHLIHNNFDRLYTEPQTIDELKQAILQLAVMGRLVPQDPNDEPAEVLLERITAERQDSVNSGEIRKQKKSVPIEDHETPYSLPEGWEWCRLSDILLYLQTGPFGSNLHKSDYVPTGTPVINPSDIRNGKINASSAKMVDQKTVNRLSSYVLRNGDVVMARRGEMGRCGAVTANEDGWLCGTGSLILRLTQRTYQSYIVKLIQAESTREYLREGSVGATMSNLNQRVLLRMPVALPPFREQIRIVAMLDNMFERTRIMAERIESAEKQRAELLDAILIEKDYKHV